jgi:hypothetical protein
MLIKVNVGQEMIVPILEKNVGLRNYAKDYRFHYIMIFKFDFYFFTSIETVILRIENLEFVESH